MKLSWDKLQHFTLNSYNQMDKKENKRSLKYSPYFNIKPKKNKKTMLFSIPSTTSLKFIQEDMVKKIQWSTNQVVRTSRIGNEISLANKQYPQKIHSTKTLPSRYHKQSSLKFFKEQNKITKQQIKNTRNNRSYKREQATKISRQRHTDSPSGKKGSFIVETRPSEQFFNSGSIDSQVYEKEIKRLSNSVQQYKKKHNTSLKKLKYVEERARQEELKYQRAKQIYLERIKALSRNIDCNKRVLGHLFTYEQMDKNIVPEVMILQVSGEEKSRDLRDIQNEIETYEQYFKSTEASLVSEISINSKHQNE